jgi:hypothetical protein
VQVNSYYMTPTHATTQGGPVIWNYGYAKRYASQLTGYIKVKMDVRAALALAEQSPYPRGVRLGVMKQVSGSKEITLEQMRILLGWAARKALKAR